MTVIGITFENERNLPEPSVAVIGNTELPASGSATEAIAIAPVVVVVAEGRILRDVNPLLLTWENAVMDVAEDKPGTMDGDAPRIDARDPDVAERFRE